MHGVVYTCGGLYVLYTVNHMEAKLRNYDWKVRRAFFLDSGGLLDSDRLTRFILPIRTKTCAIGLFKK